MAGLTLDEYDRLIHAIYEAGIDPARWVAFLDLLGRLTDGSIIVLQAHDVAGRASLGEISAVRDPEFLKVYAEHYAAINVWVPGMAGTPAGKVVFAEDFVSREELAKSEFYNGFLKRYGISTATGIALHNEADRFLFLAANIRSPNADAVRARLGALLNRLGPHVLRAYNYMRRVPLVADADYRATLAASSGGALVLNGRGGIVYANLVAERMLASGELLRRDRRKGLQFNDPAADAHLERCIWSLRHRDIAGASANIAARDAGGAVRQASFVPLPHGDDVLAHMMAALDDETPVGVLTIPDEDRHEGAMRALAVDCGLTPAETALALAVADGQSPAEYAQARGVSVNTVRSQLKSIYAKTDTRRQSQLAAMFARTRS